MSKVIKRGLSEMVESHTEVSVLSDPKRAPIISRETADAKNDAQSIRERALAEAESIRNEAEVEARRVLDEARDQGLREGRQKGANELTAMVAKVAGRVQEIESQAIPQLKELAVAIARKIIGRELEFHPEAVVDIVKQALAEKARQRREILLRIHPDDMQFIREHKADLLEVLSRAKEIALREDPDVSRHGVVIETDAGIIDAQLDSQLAAFEKVFKEMG